jgi:hypothetical protein
VIDLLLVVARTAQSVGERDQQCAERFNEVTQSLKNVACLEGVTQIRTSNLYLESPQPLNHVARLYTSFTSDSFFYIPDFTWGGTSSCPRAHLNRKATSFARV